MEKASEILKVLLGDDQLKQAGLYSSFFGAWKDIAGDKAAHSRITDIVRNAVIIEVDHPGWMQLLKMEEKKLLKTLQKRYPELEIRSLRFVLGNRSGKSVLKQDISESNPVAKPQNSDKNDQKSEISVDNKAEADEKLDQIEDPRLKLLLKKLGKAIDERQ